MIKTVKSLIFITCIIISAIAHAQTWETITSKNDVRDLYCSGDYCWVASTGGVVRVNIHDFTFQEFDVDDGLISNQCTVIGEYNGEILAGTQFHGISVFDGTAWHSDSRFDTLKNEYINCIEKSNDNRLWIGTWHGVFVYDDQNWSKFEINIGLSNNTINAIVFDHENVVWVSTHNDGIDKFNGDNWEQYKVPNLTYSMFSDAKIDTNNVIWFSSPSDGIYYLKNNEWFYINKENSILESNYLTKIEIDRKNNTKWFASYYGYLYSCNNDTLQYKTLIDTINSAEHINSISIDDKCALWVGTEKGVIHYDGSNWQRINISRFLQSNSITSIVNDPIDGIWFGTRAGATLFNKDGWQTFDRTNTDMEFDNFYDLDVDSSGHVWGIHFWDGITHYNGAEWKNYNKNNSTFPLDFPQCITAENESKVWIGGYYGGLVKYDGTEFTLTEGPDNIFKYRTITDIKVDKWGIKWIANSFSGSGPDGVGLVRYNDRMEVWQVFSTTNSGITHNNLYCIAFENDTTLWVGTTNGVSRFDGHNWISFTTQNSGLPYHLIVSMAIDKKGRKWFGTSDHGVSVLDGTNWTTFTTENSSLTGNYISAINVDKNGDIYLGTTDGVSVFKDNETGIPEDQDQRPEHYITLQNYPNPFNGETTLLFSLPQKNQVKLDIYNIYGQQVKTLYHGELPAGQCSYHWDSRDESGNFVASGIYFCRLSVNNQTVKTHRVLLLK